MSKQLHSSYISICNMPLVEVDRRSLRIAKQGLVDSLSKIIRVDMRCLGYVVSGREGSDYAREDLQSDGPMLCDRMIHGCSEM